MNSEIFIRKTLKILYYLKKIIYIYLLNNYNYFLLKNINLKRKLTNYIEHNYGVKRKKVIN
jgi:hypothetical protein